MTIKEETLIIGNGEIGKALQEVLSKVYSPVYIKDVEDFVTEGVAWLHICYPYSKDFVKNTQEYIKQYKPLFTIIHSTIPIGTIRKINPMLDSIWHSPIRGIHPHIAQGITTFAKYLGGDFNKKVMEYFTETGIHMIYAGKPENTELGKILDTTYYGWNIIFCKEVAKICEKYETDFSMVYHSFNTTYNKGYAELGMPNVVRPILFADSGKIGGHCVINNCKLLKEKITKIILKLNKKY